MFLIVYAVKFSDLIYFIKTNQEVLKTCGLEYYDLDIFYNSKAFD